MVVFFARRKLDDALGLTEPGGEVLSETRRGKGLDRMAASTSQMGRFETEWLATDVNLAAFSALSGVWIDRVHNRRPVYRFPAIRSVFGSKM